MAIAKDYTELLIWQKADRLAHGVYLLTKSFPRDEQFNLTSQLNRASLSVPTNLVEGFYRTRKEFAHFIVISFGSLKETEYLLDVARVRHYVGESDIVELRVLIGELSKMMTVFLKSITSSLGN